MTMLILQHTLFRISFSLTLPSSFSDPPSHRPPSFPIYLPSLPPGHSSSLSPLLFPLFLISSTFSLPPLLSFSCPPSHSLTPPFLFSLALISTALPIHSPPLFIFSLTRPVALSRFCHRIQRPRRFSERWSTYQYKSLKFCFFDLSTYLSFFLPSYLFTLLFFYFSFFPSFFISYFLSTSQQQLFFSFIHRLSCQLSTTYPLHLWTYMWPVVGVTNLLTSIDYWPNTTILMTTCYRRHRVNYSAIVCVFSSTIINLHI